VEGHPPAFQRPLAEHVLQPLQEAAAGAQGKAVDARGGGAPRIVSAEARRKVEENKRGTAEYQLLHIDFTPKQIR